MRRLNTEGKKKRGCYRDEGLCTEAGADQIKRGVSGGTYVENDILSEGRDREP